MLDVIADPLRNYITRRNAIRASWTATERAHRALTSRLKQQELVLTLKGPRKDRSAQARACVCAVRPR
jgi:hypothetical protein